MLAFDVVWVGGPVEGRACGATCELCNTPFGDVVNVERDGPNSYCFVTERRSSGKASTFNDEISYSHAFESGLNTISPRSESRWLS